MPYTNIELVRKHLQESVRSTGEIENYKIKLKGTDAVRLPHAGIVDGSEKVKGKEQTAPVMEILTLGDESQSLGHSDLIPESMVVAKDNSLTEIYTENVDYSVDYTAGKIRRIADGSIPGNQNITVWYYYFTLYTKASDYQISYQNGELARIDSGDIEDGQILWIDYHIESGLFTSDGISNAIMEASTQLESRVDLTLAGDATSLLTVAETYLAVSIVTQIRAIEILQSSSASASSSGNISSHYMRISARYKQDYEHLVKPYLKKMSTLSGPTRLS